MKTSQRGLELIKAYEGVRLKPYRDCVGLYTVGVGHLIGDGTVLPDSWNRTFTLGEVNDLLVADVRKFELGLARYVDVELSQNQFDAIIDYCFNLGLGTFQRSSVRQAINRRDKAGVVRNLLRYNKAGGKVIPQLDNRRKAEALLFLS